MEERLEYEPLGSDTEIDFEVALGQASYILDIASRFATENRDIESLLKIADAWVSIGFSLVDGEEEPEQDAFGFGFDMGSFERSEVKNDGSDNED